MSGVLGALDLRSCGRAKIVWCKLMYIERMICFCWKLQKRVSRARELDGKRDLRRVTEPEMVSCIFPGAPLLNLHS